MRKLIKRRKPAARNERTGKRVASIAAKALRAPWSVNYAEISAMAASLLTQAPDKPKKKGA